MKRTDPAPRNELGVQCMNCGNVAPWRIDLFVCPICSSLELRIHEATAVGALRLMEPVNPGLIDSPLAG